VETSRTSNVIRNISWAVVLQVALMLLQFFARSIFVRQLGKDYLGISGLFTDIFWILSLVNLGIPDAMVIIMYKPLAEKNYEKVRALLYLFGKLYHIIGVVVLVLGLSLIPVLPFLIKEPPHIPESIVKIYLLYLFQTVSTYYIIHKRYIIFTDQKDYIINIYQKSFHFLQIIIQIIILLTIKHFYLFLAAQVVCTISMNFFSSRRAEKMYPFIKEKNTYKLNKEEIKEVITNCKAIFLYAIGATLQIAVDSILISSIVGIGVLGLCSNYMLIVTSVQALTDKAMTGFTASIGNLNVNADKETSETVFNQVNFVFFLILAFCAINLAVCMNALIPVWLGEGFLVSQTIVMSMVLRYYVLGTQVATYIFRSTLGLLKKMRFLTIATALLNIVLAIFMGRKFGVTGIFLASSLSIFFFTIVPEALLLYKYKFEKSSFRFFLRYAGYLVFMAGNYFITSRILMLPVFHFSGWIGFFVKSSLSALISGSLFIIVFFRDKNFRAICERVIFMIKSRRNKGQETEEETAQEDDD
jgi:O-antigen/teichoic acid export membrane protein